EPDEDTPRLVYADWLDENDQEEQATFIRESITFARSGGRTGGQAPCPSQPQAWEWLKRLGLEHPSGHGFDPGFLQAVVFWSCDSFLNEAAAFVARLPVRDVGVSWEHGRKAGERAFVAMAAMPELARLHTLRLVDFTSQTPLAGWARLVQSPHLRGLKTLMAGSCGLTDDHAHALAGCENLTGLAELDLSGNYLSSAGALEVVTSPFLRKVTRLSLAENDFDVNSENPDPYMELHRAIQERFGNIEPLYKTFD